MPLLLAVTLAAAVQPSCSWDHPGRNPYTGGAAAAIDRYTDIPEAVRITLKRRMEEGQADDQVSITRDSIAGKSQYDPTIHDMHFGKASVCGTVTRAKWAETRVEPAAVYCVDKHCILVPRICGNVSRINRVAPAATASAAPAAAGRNLAPPVPELADLGLLDANPLDDAAPDMDPAERAAKLRNALDALADLGGEEEALAVDTSLFGWPAPNTGLRDHGTPPDDTSPAAPVPEAQTWAMLLAGLGIIGWQAYRSGRARRKPSA